MPGERQIHVGFDLSRDGATHLVIAETSPDGTIQIASAGQPYTDVGYTSTDGLTHPPPDDAGPPQPFHRGGIVTSTTIRPGPDTVPAGLNTGYVLSAEQVRQLGRPAATPAAPPGDILDRIDATVTEVTAAIELCACGCRRAVGPNSPSPYFASSGCQRRWHSQQATNADDVYRRRDAAEVFVSADHLAVPLQEPDGNTAPPAPAAPEGRQWQQIPGDVHSAAYRRMCRCCHEWVIPLTYRDTQDVIHSFGSPAAVRVVEGQLRLECPLCGTGLPGTPFIGTVTEAGGRLTFELSDDQSRVRRILSLTLLDRAANRDGLIRTTWSEMERMLGRFRRQFNGRAGGSL